MGRKPKTSHSLTRSLVRRLTIFSVAIFLIFASAMCYHFFKLEKSMFDLLSHQISSTLKSSIMVGDEITIRASLNRMLEMENIQAIEIMGAGIGSIRDSQPGYQMEKFVESSPLSILLSDTLAFEHTYKLYPNSNEYFTVRFFYRNNARSDIFWNSLLVTVLLIGILCLFLTRGSKMLIDRRMMSLSIDEEKSRLASQIFHLMKSDVVQMIELIDRSNELKSGKRILMRTILRSIHGTASKFIRGESHNPYSLDRYERISAQTLLEEMALRKNLEFGKKKECSLSVEIENPNSPLFMRTIPDELKLALSNIMDNAADAVGEKGEIVCQIASHDSLMSISIIDNGMGIPPDHLEKVFEMGYTSKTNGNGLGLYQAKEIISSLGGEINILSSSGEGTTVTIKLLKDSDTSEYQGSVVSSFDCILIDDSKVRRINSQKRAELKGKQLGIFGSVSQFSESLRRYEISRQTPIYLDSDLGEEEAGEIAAKRLFYEEGFDNITLYTAGDITQLKSQTMPWIRDIISKDDIQNLPI